MLTKEFIEAKKELEKAQAEIMRNPVWDKNKKALKVAEAKLAFKSRQGKIFDSEGEEVLHSNRWKYEI